MNQDSEMLDVYTEDNKTKIGIADRGVVHYCNLWHREIACWVVNKKNEILLQRGSSNKKQFPNMLSVTAEHRAYICTSILYTNYIGKNRKIYK